MRPITKFTICALTAATMAAPAYAADAFLKLGDIKGESADRILNPVPRGGGKQIEITSWSWGATNAGRVRKIDNFTSKRQHKPLARGSVRVKVRFPWLDCTVGAAFPDAVLQTAYIRYELKEVMVSSCTVSGGGGGGGGVPTESVTLNYASFRESPSPSAR